MAIRLQGQGDILWEGAGVCPPGGCPHAACTTWALPFLFLVGLGQQGSWQGKERAQGLVACPLLTCLKSELGGPRSSDPSSLWALEAPFHFLLLRGLENCYVSELLSVKPF